jgi:hypothetical protein
MKIQNEDGTFKFVTIKSADGQRELERRSGVKKPAEEKTSKAKK